MNLADEMIENHDFFNGIWVEPYVRPITQTEHDEVIRKSIHQPRPLPLNKEVPKPSFAINDDADDEV